MNISTFDAIYSLRPGAKYVLRGEALEWQDSSQTEPTTSEITAEKERLTNAEPMRLLRIERDNRLAKTDWRASSDLTLSTAWKTYRQSLRDLPSSASPKLDANGNLDMTTVTFPTEPS
jgi:hypothetical protein